MFDAIDRETERSLWSEIDRGALDRHLDTFEGLERISGSEAERQASEYVVETLTDYGVEARLHEYQTYISVPQTARVELTHPDDFSTDDCITMSFGASTPPSGVHAPVVRVEDATDPPDLQGRIAFASGLPTPDAVHAFEDAGARAAIFESPTEGHLHEMIVSSVWGTPSRETADELPNLPVVEIKQADARPLQNRLARGPVEAAVRTQVTTDLRTLPCPVGKIEGARDRYLLVGNHVDSWHEGMTDNATAVAVTLELARLFAQQDLTRGLVFGFWSAHSTGRYAGSAWYADHHWRDLRENAVGYLHLDLNGLKGADSLWYQHMAEAADEHLDVLETASDFELQDTSDNFIGGDHRPGRNSDQSFWGVGATSLLSGGRLEPNTSEGGPVGGGWWWHTPADTRDKVDLDVMHEELRVYVALLSRYCNSAILPHDFIATVSDFDAVLAEIEQETPVEFEESRALLRTLEARLQEAQAVFDQATADPELGSAIEDLQVDLGNLLIPTLYMEGADYRQEPALPRDRLPGLRVATTLERETGRETCFAETSLRRARARLTHRLSQAVDRVGRFLRTHGGAT